MSTFFTLHTHIKQSCFLAVAHIDRHTQKRHTSPSTLHHYCHVSLYKYQPTNSISNSPLHSSLLFISLVALVVRMMMMMISLMVIFMQCQIQASSADTTTNGLVGLPVLPFDEGYSHLFGDGNLMVLKDGNSVHLTLDQRTGSGFVSQDLYLHGFFSASIKLPADYTAGVVVAFYMSNGDVFEKNHDELDFEFLGNIRGKDWRIQTNIYGNGSSMGREERYGLWFDPAEDFHQYSILWTESLIIFYVDNIPIREIKRTEAMGGDFPSKPMSIYATIWDGSDWATNGGRYRVNYKYAPYIAEFSDLVLHGCTVDPIEHMSQSCDATQTSIPTVITGDQRKKMESYRKKHLTYSYCYDKTRFKSTAPSECILNPQEAERLKAFDPVTFGGARSRHHAKHRHQSQTRSPKTMAI